MENENQVSEPISFSKGQKISFSLGSLVQWFINSSFNTWIFLFFFWAVDLEVTLILLAFIIFSIWNAFNDPLIGYLSDRTHTRFGRRKPFIMIGAIPMIIIFILIWMPPAYFGNFNDTSNFIHLLLVILAYDTFYTMIALPYDALFPELYKSVEERAQVNTYKQIFSTIGLICAFLLPGMFIADQDKSVGGYFLNGIVTSIIVGVILLISIKWGVKERAEFKEDYKTSKELGFFQGLKYTLKNKGFVLYTLMFVGYQYMLLVLAAIVPMFARDVLGVTSQLMTSVLLGLLFIIGILTIIIWKKLDVKVGSKKVFFFAIIAYWIPSIMLLFISSFISGLVVISIMGFGFGGMMYFVYLIIADVIDEDELKTGVRREGTFFGVTNFFMRLSGVLSILTIGLVFSGFGWIDSSLYIASGDVVFGLRMLMFVFPTIAIGIMILALHFYPFSKKRVDDMKKDLVDLHRTKLKQVQ